MPEAVETPAPVSTVARASASQVATSVMFAVAATAFLSSSGGPHSDGLGFGRGAGSAVGCTVTASTLAAAVTRPFPCRDALEEPTP
ncbi:hypothetical protein GCM10022630_26450 [Thermobifida alba]